ncbi:MAG: alpha/beta hydrolase [Planctomycetota bacterium]
MSTLSISNEHGERLDVAHVAGEIGPPVVIGHGVTANKDRAWAVALADELVARGRPVLRFSFSGNGASEGDFRDSCPTKETEDLGSVLDALVGAEGRAIYVGHSMGGAVGVLRASRDARIVALVSLAGMVDTADFARRKFGELVPGRDVMWDKPECPLSRRFLDDMAAVGSVEELGASVEVPWLLVHGTADTVVPIEESERIARRASGEVELVRLEGVDHVFSGDAARTVARVVADWLDDLGARG